MSTKPFGFPSPKNCTPNNPYGEIDKKAILAIYNRAHKGSSKAAKYVSKKVKDWFEEQAKKTHKWRHVIFTANKCFLKARIRVC